MSAHAYTEDQLVEQSAIGLFAELGWQTVSAMEEAFGPGGTLGRETSGEVVLAPRLRAQAVKDGADRLLAPDTVKKDFMAHARLTDALYSAVKPDPVAVEFATRCGTLRALADYIRNLSEPSDISHVMQGTQALLVLGWRQKIQSRAKVRIAIEDTLDEGLPRAYTKELFTKKSEVLFEHVYEAYVGEGKSVFNQAT